MGRPLGERAICFLLPLLASLGEDSKVSRVRIFTNIILPKKSALARVSFVSRFGKSYKSTYTHARTDEGFVQKPVHIGHGRLAPLTLGMVVGDAVEHR